MTQSTVIETKPIEKMSYEERLSELEGLLTRLDNSETPIDELAANTRRSVALIKSMKEVLKKVEMEVKDAFADLDNGGGKDD